MGFIYLTTEEREEMFAIVIPKTPEPILLWARTLAPTHVVGLRGCPDACIVSEYLFAQYPTFAFETQPMEDEPGWITFHPITPVNHDDEVLVEQGFARHVPLSDAMNTFALDFDALPKRDIPLHNFGASAVDARTFLEGMG